MIQMASRSLWKHKKYLIKLLFLLHFSDFFTLHMRCTAVLFSVADVQLVCYLLQVYSCYLSCRWTGVLFSVAGVQLFCSLLQLNSCFVICCSWTAVLLSVAGVQLDWWEQLHSAWRPGQPRGRLQRGTLRPLARRELQHGPLHACLHLQVTTVVTLVIRVFYPVGSFLRVFDSFGSTLGSLIPLGYSLGSLIP